LFTQTYADENPEIINGLIAKGKNFSAAALVQYYQAMIARPDRTAVLKTFPKPILFIMGEYDNAIPCKAAFSNVISPYNPMFTCWIVRHIWVCGRDGQIKPNITSVFNEPKTFRLITIPRN
jgi:hypothetical protein